MPVPRAIERSVARAAAGFPVLAITGPRQSGKSTLARRAFPDLPVVNLEDPDRRAFAESDPRGLLHTVADGAIIDEVQRVPQLLSYLQGLVDADGRCGRFVLTGSSQLHLDAEVTQSLAGRVGHLRLLPFSRVELAAAGAAPADLDTWLFTGGYPPIYDRAVAPDLWLASYVDSYLQRDVRQLLAVGDLGAFGTFLRVCAGHVGQVVDLEAIAGQVGVTGPTARRWLAVLEASWVCFRLRPYFRNFNKRLVKRPRLYFYDTGLAARLLGLREPAQMTTLPQRGPLFENHVLLEILKAHHARLAQPELYFWRDHHGREIDVVIDAPGGLHQIECKSGATVATDWGRTLTWFADLAGDAVRASTVVYGGDEAQRRSAWTALPWTRAHELA